MGPNSMGMGGMDLDCERVLSYANGILELFWHYSDFWCQTQR